jgi:hypothetical protein
MGSGGALVKPAGQLHLRKAHVARPHRRRHLEEVGDAPQQGQVEQPPPRSPAATSHPAAFADADASAVAAAGAASAYTTGWLVQIRPRRRRSVGARFSHGYKQVLSGKAQHIHTVLLQAERPRVPRLLVLGVLAEVHPQVKAAPVKSALKRRAIMHLLRVGRAPGAWHSMPVTGSQSPVQRAIGGCRVEPAQHHHLIGLEGDDSMNETE